MMELYTVVPKTEHAEILAEILPPRTITMRLRPKGYPGTEVPKKLDDRMRALRPETCAKIGYDADEHYAQMHGAGLARFQLPVLGLWEGGSTMSE